MTGIDQGCRVYVAGHRGLVGAAVWRRLHDEGFHDLIGRSSSEVDLRDRAATFALLAAERPDVVVLAAARVGGIRANDAAPVEFLSDNLLIQTNVMDAAHAAGVHRLLFLGSSCIYPRSAPQPIREDALMTGPLEPTNAAYGVAKIAGIALAQAYRRQFGRRWICAMPTNVYGPGDTFDPETAHVLPAMIHRFEQARRTGSGRVTLWGTGTPRREFLHVDDLAEACLHLLRYYNEAEPINVGVGEDLTVRDLALLVARVVGFGGEIEWDPSMPDGTPRKLLDISRMRDLGWESRIRLEDGVVGTLAWYRERADQHSALDRSAG